MKIYVITYNVIEGIHYWENAPVPVEYLKNAHRHNFIVRCKFEVKHDDRELEIIKQQNKINNFFKDKFGVPAMFEQMSCEMIAKQILSHFYDCVSCEVLEDGFGGAEVER